MKHAWVLRSAASPVDPPAPGDPFAIIEPGTPGDDTYVGTDGPDQLSGAGGNDRLNGLEGDDVLQGGPGADILYGSYGNDRLEGGSGSDDLNGGPGDDLIQDASTNGSVIDGVPQIDAAVSWGDRNALFGGDGNDTINVVGYEADIHGDSGDDFVGVGGYIYTRWDHLQYFNFTVSLGDGADEMAFNFSANAGFATPGFWDAYLSSMTVSGGAGNDFVHGGVDMHLRNMHLYINLEDGDDRLEFSLNVPTGQDDSRRLEFNGGAGFDQLTLLASGPSSYDSLAPVVGEDIYISGFERVIIKVMTNPVFQWNFTTAAWGQLYDVQVDPQRSDPNTVLPAGDSNFYIHFVDAGSADLSGVVSRGLVVRLSLQGNSILGSHTDDIFYASSARDVINGGFGQDVVYFEGQSSAYQITTSGDAYVVTNINTEVTHVLRQVETARFANGDILLSPLAHAMFTDNRDVIDFNRVSPGDFTISHPVEGVFNALGGNDMIRLPTASGGYDAFGLRGAIVNGGEGDDYILGGLEGDKLYGAAGSDVLVGGAGDDTLSGGGGSATAPDYLFGGVGNDIYHVYTNLTGPQDLVDEGEGQAIYAGLSTDRDTIVSHGSLFWDYYSVAETLIIDRPEGGEIVGGKNVLHKSFQGGIGNDIILTFGHSSTVDAGAGTDAISFERYGLDMSYEGVNTLIMRDGSGTDYVYGFESGVDKIDLSGFGYHLSGAQWQSFLVDQTGPNGAYCFLYLGQPGQYLVFADHTASQIHAGDFIG